MCVVWRYRLAVSIILVLIVCDADASDAQSLGKVYPRGNHWAVGHLMGKKSTDDQGKLEEPGGDMEKFIELYHADPVSLRVLEALVKGQTERSAQGSAQQTDDSHLVYRLLATARHWKEIQERERQLQQAEQLIAQALGIKDESS